MKFFMDEVNAAWANAAPERISTLCSSTSKACAGFVQTAETLQQKKQHHRGDTVRLVSALAFYPEPDAQKVQTEIEELGVTVVDENGLEVDSETPGRMKNMFYLRWGHTGWIVNELKVVK